MKLIEARLVTLHHLGELTVNLILSTLYVEVRIRHPLLFEWLTADSGCLRSPILHRAHAHQERLLLGGCVIWKVSHRLLQFVQLCLCIDKLNLKLSISPLQPLVVIGDLSSPFIKSARS